MSERQSYPLNLRTLEEKDTRPNAPVENGYSTRYSEIINSSPENMKPKTKTDWEARFACEKPLQVKTIDKAFAGIPAGATMLIVTPKMVDEVIRNVPMGSVVDQSAIRRVLAKKYKADYACPVTTGIALRVVSERAYLRSQCESHQSDVTPFWRAVDPISDLAEKLACGGSYILQKRNEELTEQATALNGAPRHE
jgi:hypothetical protein